MPLSRILRLPDLVLLIVGAVIGSGIFLVPAAVLRQLGGRLDIAVLAWVVGGLLSLLGALTYAELSAQKPQAGGLYIYIRDCFGTFPAFLYGWALFFVLCGGSVATLSVAFGTYFAQLVPITPVATKIVSVLMIVVVAVINVRGTRQSSDVQNWTTGIKLLAVVGLGTALLWAGGGLRHAPYPSLHADSSLVSGFGLAMISVLWAYEGWQYCTFSAGETRDPQKNLPRAFLIGTVLIIAVYVLANIGYAAALGGRAAESDSIAASATAAVFGPAASKLISIIILVSTFSAANSFILTSTRVYYAMAADGIFFRRLADLHPRFGTPAFSVISGAAWSAVLAATGTFEQLLTYVVFSGWIFYALGAACVFVYRRRTPDASRPYSVPGYPWTPILFIAAAVALVLNTMLGEPRRAFLGLSIVLLGAPAFFIWSARKKAKTLDVYS
ncbi:MAG TPA: amino acid permease [Terriglobales bacterium]|nr:amino acid permease [Terriglobales bacterium]